MTASRRVSVRVPATSANLGPGFDCLGLALSIYNEVEMAELPDGLRVEVEGEGAADLSTGSDNLAVQAAERLFAAARKRPGGLFMRLVNRIPPSRGLGSSSAAIVGALVAANALIGGPLGGDALLQLAVDMEGHPDNVTPALVGGVTVAATVDGRAVYARFDAPAALGVAAIIPDRPLSTAEARRALPESVSRADAVFNIQRVCLMVAALHAGRLDLLPDALEDRLHQPYRGALLPGMAEVLAGGRRPGLLGATLSGSGSTMLAWLNPATPRAEQEAGVEALADCFRARGVGCRVWFASPVMAGAEIIVNA